MNKKAMIALVSAISFGSMTSAALANDEKKAEKPAKAKKGEKKADDKKGGESSCGGDKKGGEHGCGGAKK